MTRRSKQIVYGSGYLILWCFIIYGFYASFLKPPPSCTDHVRNQDETEVDCGGQFCESCAIRRLLPIRVAEVTLVPGGSPGATTAVVQFQNPNPAYGASLFHYKIQFFDGSPSSTPVYVEEGNGFIYPSELKYRALTNLPFAATANLSHTEIISEPQWKTPQNFSVPKIQTSQLKLANDHGRVLLTGTLRNTGDFPIASAVINGFGMDASRKIVAASRTAVRDVAPGEERFFQIVVPLASGVDPGSLQPQVSVEALR